MTSPSLTSQPVARASLKRQSRFRRLGTPLLLFVVTLLSTNAVGMRYMHNFRLGMAPLTSDADLLPYGWVLSNLREFASGLPFSLTLIGILLAHEFGHYFACRSYGVRATLPYLLPAPTLSGTFGAVIRLRSKVRTRAALITIAACGPIAGFVVAMAGVWVGLLLSTYAALPVVHSLQAPLLMALIHGWMQTGDPLSLIVPHPILTASWIGILITSLNLIPAGQLDGGHIMYAISPGAHRRSSRIVTGSLLALGVISWVGWILWGLVLLMPSMRHPAVPDVAPVRRATWVLVPICAVIFVLAFTFQPFHGYSLLDVGHKLARRYR